MQQFTLLDEHSMVQLKVDQPGNEETFKGNSNTQAMPEQEEKQD